MKGIILSYRRGRRTVNHNQMILEFPDEKIPASLIGRKVMWKSTSGKELHGKIIALHGRKGAVRASFSKGLPGQALGERITLLEAPAKKAPTKKVKKDL